MTFVIAAIFAVLWAVIRPGVNIVIKDTPLVASAPTDTGVWFICGTSDSGPTTPKMIQSLADFVASFGLRQSYSILYDAVDAFFQEGGRIAWISRVVGPAATLATKNLVDGVPVTSLVASAVGPGTYAHQFKVGVVAGTAGGTYQIKVTDLADVLLEQSPDLPDQDAAVAWSQNSQYIRITKGASAVNPVVQAPSAMAGGSDDRVNAVDAHWQAALDMFPKDLGPGQVSFPGRTSDTAHQALLAHAVAKNRVALLDSVDTKTVSTHTAAATASRTNGRFGGLFAPWFVLPGVVPNTTRTVPPSAVVAGIIARNDVQFNPNMAPAGDRGISRYAVGLSQAAWTDAERKTLNDQGVSTSIQKYNTFRVYGFRSLANPSTDQYWTSLTSARTIMSYAAQGDAILENHMFEDIDGQGRLFKRIAGQLIALANEFYTVGALFGASSGDAFVVVCDTSNNTNITIANKELHASVGLRVSEFAEMIQLDLVKVPVNQSV